MEKEKKNSRGAMPTVPPEAFVRAWQEARSAEEVAAKLGLPIQGARARAARYRKKGVPLQRFGGGRGLATDWQALAELARTLKK